MASSDHTNKGHEGTPRAGHRLKRLARKMRFSSSVITESRLEAIQLVFFFNYSLKIKDKSVELEKQEKQQHQRIKELEKKNGAEQRQINELQEKVKDLEGKLPEKQ